MPKHNKCGLPIVFNPKTYVLDLTKDGQSVLK